MTLSRGLPILAVASLGCATMRPIPDPTPLSQLQVRAIQSRAYSVRDPNAVLKVLVAVLQDDGFIVRYANTRLGLLDASKMVAAPGNTHTSTLLDRIGSDIGGGTFANASVEAMANVSPSNDGVTVRISFQRKLTDSSYGGTSEAPTLVPVVDQTTYQEFFAKVDKGLFLAHHGL